MSAVHEMEQVLRLTIAEQECYQVAYALSEVDVDAIAAELREQGYTLDSEAQHRKKEILSEEARTLRQAARILHNFMGHATTVPT